MAQFKILSSFQLTNRGLVIIGEILEGEIQAGDWITFKYNDKTIKRVIGNIEILTKASPENPHIGVFLNYNNEEEKEAFAKLKISEQIVLIEQG